MNCRTIFQFLAPFALSLCAACSSIVDSTTQKRDYVQAYAAGAFPVAEKMAAEKEDSRGSSGDGLMWMMEAGKSAFANGDYQASLNYFNAAEKKVLEFESRASVSARDVSSEAAASLTNPNAIPYRGSYMDRELINAYKALIYFALGKPEDACVEIRRMHERQKKSLEGHAAEIKAANDAAAERKIDIGSMTASSPEFAKANQDMNSKLYQSYANRMNPFCSYLSAIGYLWRGNLDEAMVDYRNLRTMDPANPLIAQDYATIAKASGKGVPPDLASVQPAPYSLLDNVVFLIVENGMIPSHVAMTTHMMLPPPIGYTGVSFPIMAYNPPALTYVNWSDNYGSHGQTFRISDMDAVATYEFQDARTAMLVRTVIAMLVKEGATATAYELTRHAQHDKYDYSWAADLILLGASAWKYTFNTADTRSWQTLPKEFQAANFPMPRDGILRLGVDGGPVKTVFQMDPRKKMTIVYVQSPGNGVFSVKVFQFD